MLTIRRSIEVIGASETLSAAKSGQSYIVTATATLTLPLAADSVGAEFAAYAAADAAITIVPTGADTIITYGNAAATSIASNATTKLGTGFRILCYATASGGQWIVIADAAAVAPVVS